MNSVTPFIETQFPSIYLEDSKNLVLFLEAYYEYLELNSISKVNDIDETLNEFLSFFNSKYLSNFPKINTVDNRFLIKHIMDYYRSKGSEKSLKLLMKLVFNEEVEIKYPADLIFKPSDSIWVNPKYIEIYHTPKTYTLVGKTIINSTNTASAIVESVITKLINGKKIDILYLINVDGIFQSNDKLLFEGIPDRDLIIIGSIDDVIITTPGAFFQIGENVLLENLDGLAAQAVVTGLLNASFIPDIKLIDGGYGYTLDANTRILISDQTALIDNTSLSIFPRYKVRQKFERLGVSNGSNLLTVGTKIRDVSNTNLGIISTANTTSVNVHTLGGSFVSVTNIYLQSDTLLASPFPKLSYINIDIFGEVIGQDFTRVGIKWANTLSRGYFFNNTFTKLDIFNTANTFLSTYDVERFSTGTGASFEISNLSQVETITVNTDLIAPKLSIALNAVNYGFRVSNTNINTILNNAFNTNTTSIGKINNLKSIDPGSNYDDKLFIRIINDIIYSANKNDYILTLGQPIFKSFFVNEVVTQGTAKGLVKSILNNTIRLQNLSFGSNIVSGLSIIGSTTGASANVVSVAYDFSGDQMGHNAIISGEILPLEGSLKTLKITDSGYGYISDKSVSIIGSNNQLSGSGTIVTTGVGIQSGYWNSTTSHLDHISKLHDNHYYQEYSFVVIANMSLNKYADTIRNLSQVAGTKLFGEVSINSSGKLFILGDSIVDYLTQIQSGDYGLGFSGDFNVVGLYNVVLKSFDSSFDKSFNI